MITNAQNSIIKKQPVFLKPGKRQWTSLIIKKILIKTTMIPPQDSNWTSKNDPVNMSCQRGSHRSSPEWFPAAWKGQPSFKHNPAASFQGIYPEWRKTRPHKDLHGVFTTALFTTAKNQKPLKRVCHLVKGCANGALLRNKKEKPLTHF